MKLKYRVLRPGLAVCAGLALLAACASAPSAKKNEKDPRYQYNMGLIFLNSPGADEATLNKATSHFLIALSLDPKYFLAYNALGLAYSMKGDLSSAQRAFEKCLEINPAFAEARNNLGSIYEAFGFVDKAEAEYKKALADKTYLSRQLPLYNLARMAYRQDKVEQALEYVEKAILYDSRLAIAHNLKGLILEKMDNPGGAAASYEKAAKLVPDDMNFQLNLGLACLKTGQASRAREALEKVLQRSDDPEIRQKAAEGLKQLK